MKVFFETLVEEDQKDEPRKRGRGSQKQTMATVFAQTEPVMEKKKHRPAKKCKFFKMNVCHDFSAITAKNIIQKHVQTNARMITDGYSTYQKLQKKFENMVVEKTPSKQAHIKLP